MNLLDKFLNKRNLTRQQLSNISGYSTGRLFDYNNKELNKYPVALLRTLAKISSMSLTDTLKELEEIEASYDSLLGFRKLLEQYELSFPDLEFELYCTIKDLESLKVKVEPFTFNRFEEEGHNNIASDCRKAMENAISMLSEALENVRKGKAPFEDEEI
ncbi:hypothetical protein [Enterococcus rivorum]|nr:hypothetical protein [Enterococcus rivorum]MBP2097338.1 hypothetical protein [Enterococcus rivorum]